MVVGPVSCPLPVAGRRRRPMPSCTLCSTLLCRDVTGKGAAGKVRLVGPFNVSPVAITVMATFTATANNKNNNGNHFAARRKYANIRDDDDDDDVDSVTRQADGDWRRGHGVRRPRTAPRI